VPSIQKLLLVSSILVFAALATASHDELHVVSRPHAAAAPAGDQQVIVKFDDGAAYGTSMQMLHAHGAISARPSRSGQHVLVTLDRGASVADAVARLNRTPGVEYAEANGTLHALQAATTFSPNDTFFFRQWHMRMVNAERTWAIQKGAPTVVVAVLDSGIAYEDFGPFRKAPDWGGTVFVPGFNAITGDSHANDDHFHGTHVASTIAEATNNATGVAGLAFGCALMPVKVLNANGSGTFFDITEGIYYAFRDAPQKAQVINLSLGGEAESRTLSTAIEAAVDAGVTIVAAAGNDGIESVLYPARHPQVIAVGALDARKQRAFYSNYGPGLDLMAPGGDVDRDDDGDGRPDGVVQQTFSPITARTLGRYDDFAYFYVDGTSQATPHVTAAAALLVSQGITSPAAVQAALEATAEDLGAAGRDDFHGHGLIRPALALTGLGLDE
jgi:serine protease